MSSENWAWGKGLIKKMTLIGLSLYGLIMLSLILIYKDLPITITCMTIMMVVVVQYTVPVWREKKEKEEDSVNDSEAGIQ